MKGLTALVLVAIAIGAIMHFWPRGDPQSVTSRTAEIPSHGDTVAAPSGSPAPSQAPPPTSAHPPARAPVAIAPPPTAAARIDLRAPDTVRSGDNFSVTIDVHVLRAVRHLEFAVTYRKSILRLLNSVPGVFMNREGTSVEFEESSEGHLLVRIELEGGYLPGAGSVATLEFQALRRGVSPLAVEDVAYVEVGGQNVAATPVAREVSITVD